MAVPKILRNYNMILQGRGFSGRIEELELPKLALKVEDMRQGGMDAPEGADMGMEKLESGLTAAEHDPIIFTSFGLASGTSVQAQFRAANAADTIEAESYVVYMTGRFTELDPGTLKAGDKAPLKAKIYCVYYRLELAGKPLIEIDVRQMKRIINGVDQLASQRNALLV